MKSLDDLPGDRCAMACLLLRMIRSSKRLCVRSHGLIIAAHDLAECGYARVFALEGETHMEILPKK